MRLCIIHGELGNFLAAHKETDMVHPDIATKCCMENIEEILDRYNKEQIAELLCRAQFGECFD